MGCASSDSTSRRISGSAFASSVARSATSESTADWYSSSIRRQRSGSIVTHRAIARLSVGRIDQTPPGGHSPSGCSPLSSRTNHTLANRQSRITVSADTWRASAVSSTLEPAEESHFHYMTLPQIERRQRIQGIVERDQLLTGLAGDEERFVQRYLLGAATPFLISTGPGRIHQDAPHHSGRHREEVRAVLPPHLINLDQPEVHLVDERGCLRGVCPARSPAMCRRASRRSSSWTSGIVRIQRGFVTTSPRQYEPSD